MLININWCVREGSGDASGKAFDLEVGSDGDSL
jgi:hypothetical protein